VKYAFFTAVVIFSVGSLVCALAPTSMALINGCAYHPGSLEQSGATVIISPGFFPCSPFTQNGGCVNGNIAEYSINVNNADDVAAWVKFAQGGEDSLGDKEYWPRVC
jgi:hypothetical protein